MENGTLEIRNFLVLARLLGFLYKKQRVYRDSTVFMFGEFEHGKRRHPILL